ncbi:unnamed protein product, partial [Mesorhabditis spiculigera]
MWPGILCVADEATKQPEVICEVDAVPSISTMPTSTAAGPEARKRSIATSPIAAFLTNDSPVVKKSRVFQNPADTLISFEQFTRMPIDVWLLVMNLLNPLDLLNLAYSDVFFKALITKSPKRWGTIAELAKGIHYYLPTEDATYYRLTRRGDTWESKQNYLLTYGDVYGVKRGRYFHYPPLDDKRCHYVPPDEDREPSAVQDLYILLNNATFDQFGFGAGWPMPDPKKYKNIPYVRAHTAMLPIEGPKQVLCRQIAETKPYCVAVHCNSAGQAGELRAVINDVLILMPDLKKLWLHFGREILETECLVDVKTPTIVVYMAVMKEVPGGADDHHKKYEPISGLLEQFNHTLFPTLQTIITQWENREREIDYIELKVQKTFGSNGYDRGVAWHELDEEFEKLPSRLCEGRVDVHEISMGDWYCMIRRGPWSNEGLIVTIRGGSIILCACSYTSRRHLSYHDCWAYNDAVDAARGQLEKICKRERTMDGQWIGQDRAVTKHRCEVVVNEWINSEMYKTLPPREVLIERKIYNYWSYPSYSWPFMHDELGTKDDPILNAYNDLFNKE